MQKNMQTICQKLRPDMQKKLQKYAQFGNNMQQKYALHSKICKKYAAGKNMPKSLRPCNQGCKTNARNMQEICKKYAVYVGSILCRIYHHGIHGNQ